MKRYKVVGSSKSEFMDIDMNFVFEDISIGKTCEVFGFTFTITQTGKVLVLVNQDWVLTLQEIASEPIDLWTQTITKISDLRINHEIDLFFATKVVQITSTDRIANYGLTFECLYKFLLNEWKFISHLTDVKFPFEYNEEFKLFILNDEWNLIGDVGLLKDGSFSRYNSEGRCI